MKLVILSQCDLRSQYVIREIMCHRPVTHVIRPLDNRSPLGSDGSSSIHSQASNSNKPFLTTLGQKMERLASALYRRYEGFNPTQIYQVLFDESHQPPAVACFSLPATEINSRETERSIRALEPDILLVSVAPILKRNIFSIPRIATINVHYGVAPNYRGEDTLFWPLFFRDYERVGVTIHRIDAGVDTGEVYARGCPMVQRNDTVATLTAKCTMLAAKLVVEVLDAAERGVLEGKKQSSEGRQFFRRERTGWKELQYLLRRDILRHRPPCLPERIWKFLRTEAGEQRRVA